jgi:hypothetical protein
MKTITGTLLATFFVICLIAPSTAVSADAVAILAAHNALHRLGSLVDQQKVDSHFSDNLKALFVALNPQGGFFVSLQQYSGADGKANSIKISVDAQGKAGDYTLEKGSPAVGSPSWPDKSAIELLEEGLHQVLHHVTSPEVVPFSTACTSVMLVQSQDGGTRAVVDIRSSAISKVYRITMGTDGKVLSAAVVDK